MAQAAPKSCSVDGCTKPHKAHGWCHTHYMRWRRAGSDPAIRLPVRAPRTCTIGDCAARHFGHGMCHTHYERWRKWGDPKFTHWNPGDPDGNFANKVIEMANGCWQWTGAKDPGGYGCFRVDGRTRGAHRWAYERYVAEIPEGLELDHICHTADSTCTAGNQCPHRSCVNPDHLEPVTPLRNWQLSGAPSVANAVKTHCANGHPFDLANTYHRTSGGRGCRTCIRVQVAAYVKRKKEQRKAG